MKPRHGPGRHMKMNEQMSEQTNKNAWKSIFSPLFVERHRYYMGSIDSVCFVFWSVAADGCIITENSFVSNEKYAVCVCLCCLGFCFHFFFCFVHLLRFLVCWPYSVALHTAYIYNKFLFHTFASKLLIDDDLNRFARREKSPTTKHSEFKSTHIIRMRN